MNERRVSPLKIPFDLEAGRIYDLAEIFDFWHSPETISWFQENGYTYTPLLDETTRSLPPSGVLHEVDYPFASYDSSGPMPLGALEVSSKVIYCQDSCDRHVAIKLVRTDSDEYRVLRYLSQQSLDTLKENCLIPVLNFIHNEEYTFAVMPRWGSSVHLPWITRAQEVLQIMHSMLKACGMHWHFFMNIISRTVKDMNQSNVLVNHFSDSALLYSNPFRADLRSKGMLCYAVFDFDFSVMLPPDADKSKYRLPYQRSWGSFNYTMDTAQGEFDYDPFVMDVGVLGVRFCMAYQHITGEIPLLAPLLDRMTTRDLEHRFTASEALHFFEQMYSQLPEEELNRYVQTRYREMHLAYDEYDRWALVPPEFAKKWAAYREPPIPWSLRVLRIICSKPWMRHIIPWSRWMFSRTWMTRSIVCENHICPQKSFPIPQGILNYSGRNTLAVTLWAEDAGGAKLNSLDLQFTSQVESSMPTVVNQPMPVWTKRPGAF